MAGPRVGPRRICDIYDFFAPHINVLTYFIGNDNMLRKFGEEWALSFACGEKTHKSQTCCVTGGEEIS